MKNTLLHGIAVALCFPFIANILNAQDGARFNCAQTEMRQRLLKEHPEILQLEQALEESTKEFIAGSRKSSMEKSNQGKIIIPLVFHILNQGGAENISDEQVRDEVRILNRDYNKQNEDTNLAVAFFPNIIGDMGVEWRLANIDPNGNCTNGIDRITTDQTLAGDDYSKLNSWPREKYLNVWVLSQMPLTPKAAGYAYFPSDVQNLYQTPSRDGVIIVDNYIGTIGTGSAINSRALTHEIGHCFNLQHCWGLTNAPGVACGDDGVEDTPITKGFTSCPLSLADAMICTPGVVENYQNYMEYSYCSIMFTEGQKARWMAAANSSMAQRNNLWSDSNLIATGTYDTSVNPCAPIANFCISRRYICRGDTVSFRNSSGNGDSIQYYWEFPTGTPSYSTDTNPTVQFNTVGWQQAKLTVSNGHGSNSRTDSTLLFVGYDIAQETAPYYQGFEDPNIFNENTWVSVSYDGNNPYNNNITSFKQAGSGYHNGNGVALLNNYDARANWDINEIISPPIDLTSVPSGQMNLSFSYSCATGIPSYTGLIDSFCVYASTDCGRNWVFLYKMGGAIMDNAGYVSGRYIAPQLSAYWQKATINLARYGSIYQKPDVLFKFRAFSSVGGNNLYIDDINIGDDYTGLTNLSELNSAVIFPNPGDGTATLNLVLNRAGAINVDVFNLSGQKVLDVFDGNLNGGENQLGIKGEQLAAGIYIVNIRDGSAVAQRKLVIR